MPSFLHCHYVLLCVFLRYSIALSLAVSFFEFKMIMLWVYLFLQVISETEDQSTMPLVLGLGDKSKLCDIYYKIPASRMNRNTRLKLYLDYFSVHDKQWLILNTVAIALRKASFTCT